MAPSAPKAHSTGPGTLTFGADTAKVDFSGQVSSVKIAPDSDEDDAIDVLSGAQVPGAIRFSSTLEATFLQDFDARGCIAYSWENAGETVDFEFIPATAHGARFTGQVVVQPMEVGGDVRKKNTSDIKWQTVGLPKPTFTEPEKKTATQPEKKTSH